MSGILEIFKLRFEAFPFNLGLLLVVYPLCAYPVLRIPSIRIRDSLFALLNGLSALLICRVSVFAARATVRGSSGLALFLVYLAIVLGCYIALRLSGMKPRFSLVAMLLPVVVLVVFKSFPLLGSVPRLKDLDLAGVAASFAWMSYLCFRLAHLGQEVRNEIVPMPSLASYLSFAFFVPTLFIGPISPYSFFAASIGNFDRSTMPVGRSLLRILVGLTKYRFFASILGHMTYLGLLRDGHPHGLLDLTIAVLVYPIYLYCDFSGFCDIAIGVSGLLGIRVMENFDHPFSSRNYQEFWTRWHISLSSWFRDMVFTPLTKALMRVVGPKQSAHCTAASIVIVFLLLGLWHAITWNFMIFGLWQGVGVATVFYWTGYQRRRLGKEAFQNLKNNAYSRVAGQAALYVYFAASMFFFANSTDDMAMILRSLR